MGEIGANGDEACLYHILSCSSCTYEDCKITWQNAFQGCTCPGDGFIMLIDIFLKTPSLIVLCSIFQAECHRSVRTIVDGVNGTYFETNQGLALSYEDVKCGSYHQDFNPDKQHCLESCRGPAAKSLRLQFIDHLYLFYHDAYCVYWILPFSNGVGLMLTRR